MPVVITLPPEVTEKLVYPVVPPELLTCPRDPKWAPDIKYDTDIPIVDLNAAWFGCWSKLEALQKWIESWPR